MYPYTDGSPARLPYLILALSGHSIMVVTIDEPQAALCKAISCDVRHTVWDRVRRFRHLLAESRGNGPRMR